MNDTKKKEPAAIRPQDLFRELQRRYPGISLVPSGINSEKLLERMQYTVQLSIRDGDRNAMLVARYGSPGAGKGVEIIARYRQVEFREPYKEAYLETRDMGEMRKEILRLADSGYAVVKQELMFGVSWGCDLKPVKRV